MNDKEKQIEEMARDIECCCNRYDNEGRLLGNKCSGCEYWCDTNNLCCSFGYKESEYLYNLGYRKIPEDSVVLTREEYEQWYKGNEFLEKVFERAKQQARKETAREIFNELDKKKIVSMDIRDNVEYLVSMKGIKELARQYGVEIGEV